MVVTLRLLLIEISSLYFDSSMVKAILNSLCNYIVIAKAIFYQYI